MHAATVPTVGDAIEALSHFCDDLSSSLKRITDISAELNSKAYIRVENIEDVRNSSHGMFSDSLGIQIIPVSDPSLLDNLDMRQRQSLIARELGRWRTEASRRAHITMSKSLLVRLISGLTARLQAHWRCSCCCYGDISTSTVRAGISTTPTSKAQYLTRCASHRRRILRP